MLNKVQLIGNLGADPEVRYTAAGKPVANMRVATNERWRDQNGELHERTEWHRIVLWGKLAELAGEYLTKGRLIHLEGKLQTRKWEDREGVERYTTEIVATHMVFLPDARKGNQVKQAVESNEVPMADVDPQENEEAQQYIGDDDVPF